jgi:hypothetical protein
MSSSKFEKLNKEVHELFENSVLPEAYTGRQPPYIEQALMFNILIKNGFINETSMIDYAGGKGTLSTVLKKYFGVKLFVYEPYVRSDKDIYVETENLKQQYELVFNSAFMEHIRFREDLEKMNRLVAEQGCFMFHTVVCENIPKDPNWFYIEAPVHCAFHTNKSMEILMKQWGYNYSIYSPIAKCWLLLKHEMKNMDEKINLINSEFQERYFYYKRGFIDYWKGF